MIENQETWTAKSTARATCLVVMLRAFLDLGEKRDSADAVMCVASVIFKPTRYKQFVRAWKRMLKRWGASAFHATDFYSGAKEFVRDSPGRKQLFDEDSRKIPKLIGGHIRRVFFVSFRPEEFNSVASPEWKQRFGTSTHSHGVQLALIANGWWRYEKCPHESFTYFMETGDVDEGEVVRTVERMRQDRSTGTSQLIGVASFSAVGKGQARGLEAADFVAWHWNKHYMDRIRMGDEDNPRKDFAAFVDASADKIEYIFATRDKLKYLFSSVQSAR